MNSRRLLFPLLVLLVAGVFWWLGPESTGPTASEGPGPAAPAEQVPEEHVSGGNLSEGTAPPGASARSSAVSMQTAGEEAEPAVRAPDASQLTIDVVGPDGQSFALRSIFSAYSEAPEDRERLASLMGNWSVNRSRAEYGRMRSEGRRLSLPAELPPFEQRVTVFAMTRDSLLRGTLELEAGEVGERRLLLDTPSRIIVHVVDTNGADVVGVLLRLLGSTSKPLAGGPSSSSGRLAMSLPTRTTDEDRESLRVEVLQRLGSRVVVPVAAGDFEARREVQIEVPATGTVELVLGAGFDGIDGNGVEAYLRPEAEPEFGPYSVVVRAGETTRVEHVGLNQALRVAYKLIPFGVHIRGLPEGDGLEGLVFTGPTEDRPVVEVRLERVPDYLEFRGRLVDPESSAGSMGSSPGLKARVQALSVEPAGRGREQLLIAEPSGEFRLVWGDSDSEQRRTQRLVFTVDPSAFAIVDVPGPDGRGVVDGIVELGEVVLAPMPSILAGRVLDPRGEPVANATVLARPALLDPVVDLGLTQPKFHYSVQSKEDGSFRLWSAPQADWWKVEAWTLPAGGARQSGVLERVALGAEDVVIDLRAE